MMLSRLPKRVGVVRGMWARGLRGGIWRGILGFSLCYGAAVLAAEGSGGKVPGKLFLCPPGGWDSSRLRDFERQQRLPVGKAIGRATLYTLTDEKEARGKVERIQGNAALGCAGLVSPRAMAVRSFDPLFAQQWHLENHSQSGGRAGDDAAVLQAWDRSDGSGVVVAIVDDGLEVDHPDLSANVRFDLNRDLVDGGADPTAGYHGTGVGGLVAAVRDNGLGGSGVAPNARLVGLRLLDEESWIDESVYASAISEYLQSIDVLNHSWGPPDNDLNAFEGPSGLTVAAFEQAVTEGRGGLGQLLFWAAGNGGGLSSNLDGFANSRFTVAVTATTDFGVAPHYAEGGGNVLLNAPSNGGAAAIVTTDITGAGGINPGGDAWELADPDYTNGFGGTSAAAPIASGVAALVLAANPALGWRDVTQILAFSAARNDPDHPWWRRNGAGFWVNEQYGFGRVNAIRAVELARTWGNRVTSEVSTAWYQARPERTIPDADGGGVESSINVTDRLRVESAEVRVNVDHTYWGDLAFYLTSPSGQEVRLVGSRFIDAGALTLGYFNWTMTDVLHLGESGAGTWTLRIADEQPPDAGVLHDWSLRLHGAPLPSVQDLPVCEAVQIADGTHAATLRIGLSVHGGPHAREVQLVPESDVGLSLAAEVVAEKYLLVLNFQREGAASNWFEYTTEGWVPWNRDVDTLHGFASPELAQGGVLDVHQGLVDTGEFALFFGYRGDGGNIAYCPEPAVVRY